MAVHMLPGVGYDCNIFVITGSRPLIVDAGTGEHHARTVDKIRKIIGDRKVQGIVLTHRHYDHVGGAAALSRDLGAPLFAHRMMRGHPRGSSKGTGALMFMRRMEAASVQNLIGKPSPPEITILR